MKSHIDSGAEGGHLLASLADLANPHRIRVAAELAVGRNSHPVFPNIIP